MNHIVNNGLEVKGIGKSFFGVPVLQGVSFTITAGRALGLVGENGSGKSTSMNILGGVHQPDEGTMRLDGETYAPAGPGDAIAKGIAFIHQELNLFGNLSIEDNLFLNSMPRRGRLPIIDRASLRDRALELLAQVDLPLDPSTPVSRLSQGERQLLEIAKALSRNARIIIFDEPTTSLTRREIDRLFGLVERLKARGLGIVFISHTLEDVFAVCETICILRDGKVVGEGRREDFSIQSIIRLMVGRSIETVFPARPARPSKTRPMLDVQNLSQPGVVRDISFKVHAGEIVGLAGLLGSGRTELARMIFGLDPYAQGSVTVAGQRVPPGDPKAAISAGMAFLTEDRRGEGLLMESTIEENLSLTSLPLAAGTLGLLRPARLLEAASAMARTIRLSTERVAETLAKHLSGGNQQKVVIGKWLMRSPSVFILDEPTRGIDVGAKQEVYRIVSELVSRGNGVLLISSEIEELLGLSDRIISIRRGELGPSFTRHPFDRELIMAAVAASLETSTLEQVQ